MRVTVEQIGREKEEQVLIQCTAVVNLMRVSYLRPGLNGRLSARLTNGEDIIISRKYVNALKARLQNE